MEKQIQATNEELTDAQYKASQDAEAAAASEKALQEQLEQAKAEVGTRRTAPGQGHIACAECLLSLLDWTNTMLGLVCRCLRALQAWRCILVLY